ncbi:hypothetical protein [Prosthecobacter sp.]|uniref:hypothetical protein n=1 Tax=Prosthecobacter sp. TaxID=1965333 RepID=UPI0037833854
MKRSLHPSCLFLIAAPMLALPLLSSAQTLAPTTVTQTTSVTLPQDLHASGTISSFNAKGMMMLDPITGSMTEYMTNADTMFVDTHGRAIPPDRITQDTPVTVHYTPVGNMIVATKVVANTALTSDGTLVEVSPGVLVIQMPGASTTPARYVNNTTTNYVDQNGKPVPPASVKAGAPVRVFYTKVGDTLIASKVEVLGAGPTGLPKPPVKTETTRTTVTREVRR